MQAYSEGGHSQLFLLSDSSVSSLQLSSAYGQEQTRSSDGKKELHVYWIECTTTQELKKHISKQQEKAL